MLEKLKANSRLVVAVLVTLGVLVLIVGGSNSNDNNTAENEDAKSTVSSNEEDATKAEENEEIAEPSDPIGQEPVQGRVSVEASENSFTSEVRTGDNQTVIVRQIVNEYLSSVDKSLTAARRLYMETNLVNGLPKNDLVYAGQTVRLDTATLKEITEKAEALSPAQESNWARYL